MLSKEKEELIKNNSEVKCSLKESLVFSKYLEKDLDLVKLISKEMFKVDTENSNFTLIKEKLRNEKNVVNYLIENEENKKVLLKLIFVDEVNYNIYCTDLFASMYENYMFLESEQFKVDKIYGMFFLYKKNRDFENLCEKIVDYDMEKNISLEDTCYIQKGVFNFSQIEKNNFVSEELHAYLKFMNAKNEEEIKAMSATNEIVKKCYEIIKEINKDNN